MARTLRHPHLQDVTLAEALSALGDPVRLRIVAVLADCGEHPREDFDLGVGPSTVSHHMTVLRAAGLTHHRVEGTRCFVSLRKDALRRFADIFDGVLQEVAREVPVPAS